MVEHTVETDVLVVGGGMAGCFAAIKAKEQGVDVTLVDKGYVSKSGQTPWAGAFLVFNPEWGHSLDAWMKQVNVLSEYVNNREWTETVFKDTYARYQDLLSWGVKFTKMEGRPRRRDTPLRVTEGQHLEPTFPQVLRRQAVKMGVTIMDRIMITDLIKQKGSIVGAVGIPLDSLDIHIFNAKATIISAGAGGFKPYGAWPIANLTADGHAMAYRVGAEITGKEFEDFHGRSPEPRMRLPGRRPPQAPSGDARTRAQPPRRRGRLFNSEGKEIIRREDLMMDFEAHMGHWPFKDEEGNEVRTLSGAAPGMSVHTTEGIWPTDTQCATGVPGLYAAGDSLATLMVGAYYASPGSALATCTVTGARAGTAATEYAKQQKTSTLSKRGLTKVTKSVHAPLERKGGFTPRWVTQVLRNLMIPYFISRIKHKDRLEAALTMVAFIRDHLVPKMYAKDPHELRLAHETKNMVLNAEMRLQASLFRTESRGCHFREDYPHRVDPDWLAWVLLKDEKGTMAAYKKPIPEAWRPDLSKPYEERYLFKLPGE